MPTLEIGPAQFALARRAARDEAASRRRSAQAAALTALQGARDAYREHLVEVYGHATSAARDAEILEDAAEVLLGSVEGVRPLFESLDLARDVAIHQGPVLTRRRGRYDRETLARLVAEALAEETLSGPAGAVLLAAVAYRAAALPDARP